NSLTISDETAATGMPFFDGNDRVPPIPAFFRRRSYRNGSTMRLAAPLLCLCLAACAGAGGTVTAAPPAPEASVAARPSPPSGSGGGPRGGASTAAARGEPVEVPPDPLTQ